MAETAEETAHDARVLDGVLRDDVDGLLPVPTTSPMAAAQGVAAVDEGVCLVF